MERAGARVTIAKMKVTVWTAMALLISTIAMQGCGGSSSSTAANPTTLNPAPGVTLQAIQITPSTPFISLGENRQLYAMGVYSDGGSVDITAQVKWTASTPSSTTSNVGVASSGIATGVALGSGIVSATVGPVTGVLQLLVDSNGYSSSTIAILSVPYKTAEVDAAYLPLSQATIQGNYAVQEVNLDADQFSSVLPVPVSLLSSIPMPAGFVPNVTVASPGSALVAVISYTSPDIQIIDASNLSTDVSSNTLINTFKAPVTKSVTFNGITCMICAAVVNPANNQLLMSTAEGYFSMDLTAGTFTALPFNSNGVLPAPTFTLNPIGSPDPYIVSSTFGQGSSGELQFVDMTTNAVTTNNTLGFTAPYSSPIDLSNGYAAVVDSASNYQVLLNVSDLQNLQSVAVPGLGLCSGQSAPPVLGMTSLGIAANVNPSVVSPNLYLSQASGSCFGFEVWPSDPLASLTLDQYGYGALPATPDGNAFVNGNDPNTIASFNSVVDKKNYAILVDANQNWIAKINPALVLSFTSIGALPSGSVIPTAYLAAGQDGDSVIYLPTPASIVTLSDNNLVFASQAVGTSSPQFTVTLSNIGQTSLTVSQISIQGTNASDFSEADSCVGVGALIAQSKCTINVIFTPSATGTRAATLSITDNGGASPQVIQLSGSGT
jgi:hypothetical protein